MGWVIAVGWGFVAGWGFAAGLYFTGCLEFSEGIKNVLGKARYPSLYPIERHVYPSSTLLVI